MDCDWQKVPEWDFRMQPFYFRFIDARIVQKERYKTTMKEINSVLKDYDEEDDKHFEDIIEMVEKGNLPGFLAMKSLEERQESDQKPSRCPQ